MTIVAISICSRLGSPIISRNFTKISHSRLEQLLVKFTNSLLSSQQHSYVEIEDAVFVFQPLNQLYLVMTATKLSNAILYIECLHLAGRFIASLCDSLEDQEILSKGAEILLALDEIVLSGTGTFDSITLPQINSNLLMQSHEEELQELIEKNKIQEARQVGKLRMKQIESERKEANNKSGYSSFASDSGLAKSREDIATEKIDLNTKISSKPIHTAVTVDKGQIERGMSVVNILNIQVLDNPTKFLNPFQFEITFECISPLKEDLEWKIIYVGSAEDDRYDQVLDSIMVGPIPVGINKFVFQTESPNPSLIPESDLIGVTVVLIVCSYNEQEFVRVGYYVNNEYEDPEMRENPPEKVDLVKVVRNILSEKPRVTRVPIRWDNLDENPEPSPQDDEIIEEEGFMNGSTSEQWPLQKEMEV